MVLETQEWGSIICISAKFVGMADNFKPCFVAYLMK